MSKNWIILLIQELWGLTGKFFWLALWIFGLGLLVWYPLRWWPGDRLWPVRLMNYFMPWLLLFLLPSLIIAILTYRKWLIVVLAIPTLLIGLTFAPLFLPRPGALLAAGTPLKIMSYNVLRRNENISTLAAVIRQEQPDILLLQELRPRVVSGFETELADLYPDGQLYVTYEPEVLQAVISRYPLTPLALDVQKGKVQKVIVDTPTGPIAVWNVHPSAPLPWFRQYRQLSALADDIAAVEGPLIVGGDFNTTDQSENYRLINQYLSNAHWEAGWGFGFTFPASTPDRELPIETPIIRIDHIFYSHHFFARSAWTLADSGGSDHLPVVAELSFIRED